MLTMGRMGGLTCLLEIAKRVKFPQQCALSLSAHFSALVKMVCPGKGISSAGPSSSLCVGCGNVEPPREPMKVSLHLSAHPHFLSLPQPQNLNSALYMTLHCKQSKIHCHLPFSLAVLEEISNLRKIKISTCRCVYRRQRKKNPV